MRNTLKESLRALIEKGETHTQQEICAALAKQGFEISQTKISRLLPKLGVAKVKDSHGNLTYQLTPEQIPPQFNKLITELTLEINANEYLIVVTTQPGCASMVARFIDFNKTDLLVLNTIAGDDTIFVTPTNIVKIQESLKAIKNFLSK